MADVAIERLLCVRINLMLGVIEIRLWHPAVDENRFGDSWRGVRDRLDLVTKRAAVKRRAHLRRRLPFWRGMNL